MALLTKAMSVSSRAVSSVRGLATSKAANSAAGGVKFGAHDSSTKMWKNLTFFVAFPCIILANINAFMPAADGHDKHARPEFKPYDHLRLRSKKFPWGDGNHSLFHNPHVNALPDGYEDDHH